MTTERSAKAAELAQTDSRIAEAKAAVLAQTERLHREFGLVRSEWKADGSRVTAVDRAISKEILGRLAAAFPEDEFFSEEMDPEAGPQQLRADYAWILDPIDGTNNYAAGVPYCAISLGLLRDGRPIYGVIYDLARRLLIHGGPGFGLFDGDRPGRVKADPPGKQSLVGLHSPFDRSLTRSLYPVIEEFKLRGLGSSTLHLAYVAVGILDGCIDHNVKIWDIAAAYALCLAGGGEFRFLNGDVFPLRQFDLNMPRIHYVAGNPAVCGRLKELLYKEPRRR